VTVRFIPPAHAPKPTDTPIWTIERDGRSAQAVTRIDLQVDGLELKFTRDTCGFGSGRFNLKSAARTPLSSSRPASSEDSSCANGSAIVPGSLSFSHTARAT
jgi:hypothetical protein